VRYGAKLAEKRGKKRKNGRREVGLEARTVWRMWRADCVICDARSLDE